MPSLGRRKRTKGRWRATLLLATALATVANSVAPVRAAPPAAPRVTATQPVKPPKHKDKKHGKKHKKKDDDTQNEKKPKSITDMIEQVFGKHADEALRIAFCESRFDADDVSSAGAVGVFQIRAVDHGWRVQKVKDAKDLFDPWTNVRVARHIFDHQGWRPWVCARIVGISSGKGSYRRHSISSVSTWPPNEGSRRPRVPRRPGNGTMTTWP